MQSLRTQARRHVPLIRFPQRHEGSSSHAAVTGGHAPMSLMGTPAGRGAPSAEALDDLPARYHRKSLPTEAIELIEVRPLSIFFAFSLSLSLFPFRCTVWP
ncbi:hypothetical protein QOT17_011399 [Balamuthia mandrillaris]